MTRLPKYTYPLTQDVDFFFITNSTHNTLVSRIITYQGESMLFAVQYLCPTVHKSLFLTVFLSADSSCTIFFLHNTSVSSAV